MMATAARVNGSGINAAAKEGGELVEDTMAAAVPRPGSVVVGILSNGGGDCSSDRRRGGGVRT